MNKNLQYMITLAVLSHEHRQYKNDRHLKINYTIINSDYHVVDIITNVYF